MIHDHMGEAGTSSSMSDPSGVAHLTVWPHRYLELRASLPGFYNSRCILGPSGWGNMGQVWQHSWGSESRGYFGLGCAFLDDALRVTI